MKLRPRILALKRLVCYQRKYRSRTWNRIDINQSLLRKVSDYSDNLNLV